MPFHIILRQQLADCPYPIRNPHFHRRRDPQGLVNPNKPFSFEQTFHSHPNQLFFTLLINNLPPPAPEFPHLG
jgi:hypothetical protein